MRKAFTMFLAAIATLGVLAFGSTAHADEVKMVGVVTKIEISGKDATSAVVTLKDNKTEENVLITVNDDLTLDKFKDHRIGEGDEIRCKYESAEGKNVSKLFRKTAGC